MVTPSKSRHVQVFLTAHTYRQSATIYMPVRFVLPAQVSRLLLPLDPMKASWTAKHARNSSANR